uniref:Uncharacterized protein n=1 Tax=Parascaris equorum TaxID=6256 RepID=A0A914SAL6_PAREQ
MNETEEAISSCIEEVLKKSDALQCSTTEQRNVRISEDNEIIESCSNIVVTNSSDVKSTDPDDPVEVKGTCCRLTTPSEPHVAVEDEIIDTCALPHPTTKVFDVSQ